jgi:hypothetical protein
VTPVAEAILRTALRSLRNGGAVALEEVGDKLRLAVEDRFHVMPSYYRYWEGLDPRLKLRGGEVRPPAAVPVKPDRLKQGATSPQRALAGCIF